MKYFKHMDGDRIKYFAAEGTPNVNVPPDENNMDYVRILAEIDAGTSTVEEVSD
jgi:hypothetical protein|tara:strand:+ start:1596 stop:1757 length:162 start_codon:yes stop_codon:yes gene_type:complete